MTEALKIPQDELNQIPDTPEGRMKAVMGLPLNNKRNFMPPVDMRIKLGPYVYKVGFVNAGQLRFTAKLCDVIIEGVNDGEPEESLIINPHTGKEIGNA